MGGFLFKRIKSYIIDDKLRINVLDNKVNVVNYIDIITIENERICILSESKKIIIKGSSLTLNKLLENEVLISGDIKSIELE